MNKNKKVYFVDKYIKIIIIIIIIIIIFKDDKY